MAVGQHYAFFIASCKLVLRESFCMFNLYFVKYSQIGFIILVNRSIDILYVNIFCYSFLKMVTFALTSELKQSAGMNVNRMTEHMLE